MGIMLKKEDVEHLAALARIELSDAEMEEVATKLSPVLNYVSEISKVVTEENAEARVGKLRNVMRPDGEANVGGEYTDAILKNAPRSQDGYFKVSQIM